jgi:hypothetical protein
MELRFSMMLALACLTVSARAASVTVLFDT